MRGAGGCSAPVGGDPGWTAAFAGGLTAGVVGALVEDSGPLLLVGAMLALACIAAYLHGRPPAARPAPAAMEVLPGAVALAER